jgi:hypothetical protein
MENCAASIAAATLPRQAQHEDIIANSAFIKTRLCLENSRKGRTLIYISCHCDLRNLALHDALESSSFLQRPNRSIFAWAHRLYQRQHCRATRKSYPTIHQGSGVIGISFAAFSQSIINRFWIME